MFTFVTIEPRSTRSCKDVSGYSTNLSRSAASLKGVLSGGSRAATPVAVMDKVTVRNACLNRVVFFEAKHGLAATEGVPRWCGEIPSARQICRWRFARVLRRDIKAIHNAIELPQRPG